MKYNYVFKEVFSDRSSATYSYSKYTPRSGKYVDGFANAFRVFFDAEPIINFGSNTWNLEDLEEIVNFCREECKKRREGMAVKEWP